MQSHCCNDIFGSLNYWICSEQVGWGTWLGVLGLKEVGSRVRMSVLCLPSRMGWFGALCVHEMAILVFWQERNDGLGISLVKAIVPTMAPRWPIYQEEDRTFALILLAGWIVQYRVWSWIIQQTWCAHFIRPKHLPNRPKSWTEIFHCQQQKLFSKWPR